MDAAIEQPVAPPVEAPAAPVEETSSLAEHEALHSPDRPVAADDEPASDGTRDEQGRFAKPRHRAKSQQARAEDVPRISELTRKLREAEAERDALKSSAPRAATPPAAAAAPVARPSAQATRQIPQSFPTYEQFITIEGNADADFDAYIDARADWRYETRRAAERQQEAQEREHRTISERVTAHQSKLTAAKAKYADWDTVVTNDIPVSRVLHDAILASEHGPEIQYYLGKHRDVCAELVSESQEFSPSAVAAMRRYLDTLVASEQRATPPAPVAATTGSALALVPPPAPRPPNPVRTGTQAPADAPPGDEDSLAAHEKHYGGKRR